MADTTLLIKNADLLCTMEPSVSAPFGAEISDSGLFARNGVIEQVGKTISLPGTADQIIDMRGHVVVPGMVNTHHHMFQNLSLKILVIRLNL